MKENCHNSISSDDIDIKLGPVTKLDKRNKTTSKKINDDVMSENFDVTAIFSIYGQFGAFWKPHSGRIVCKTYIVINSNLLSYNKHEQQLKRELKGLLHSSHTIALSKSIILTQKC